LGENDFKWCKTAFHRRREGGGDQKKAGNSIKKKDKVSYERRKNM